ncbi:MAG: hypothetical protein AB1847_04205 [bacterium]
MCKRTSFFFSSYALSTVLMIGMVTALATFPLVAWPKEVEYGSSSAGPVFSEPAQVEYGPSAGLDPLEPAAVEKDSRSGSVFSLGDFAKNFSSSVNFSTEEEYNDNVFLDANAGRSDFITRIKLGMKADLAGHYWNISLDYQPEQILYSRNADQNELKHQFTFSLNSGLDRKITLFRNLAYLEFSDTVTRENLYSRRQPHDESPLVHQTTRNELRIYPYLKKRISRTNSLEFGYEYINTGYSDSQATDREAGSGLLILRKKFSRRMEGNISYRLGRELAHGNAFQDYTRQEASVGLTDQVGPLLTLTGTGGYTWLMYHNMDDSEGTYWNIGLSGALPLMKVPVIFYQYANAYRNSVEDGLFRLRRHSLGGSYDHRIKVKGAVFTQTESYQERDWEDASWGVDGSFSIALHKKIDLVLACGWMHNHFKPEDEKVKSRSADTSLLFRVLPWARLTIGYRYSRRDSNLDDNASGYENTIVSVRADMEL